MLIYKVAKIEPLQGEEWEERLARLPAWRRVRVLAYRRPEDRLRSLAASELLVQGCKELGWGTDGGTDAHGKPQLTESGHYFSLSHAGDYAVAAFADTPVGIDVEYAHRFTGSEQINRLADKILTEKERASWNQIDDPQKRESELIRIWTCKEAYAKMLGTGLATDFAQIETTNPAQYQSSYLGGAYWMSICRKACNFYPDLIR